MTGHELTRRIAKTLDDKKALDIEALHVTNLTILADYFIIATGTSSTHVKSLADEVEHVLELKGVRPGHIEGKSTMWILLDYGTVIVHIFNGESRAFYDLERLWKDSEKMDVAELIK